MTRGQPSEPEPHHRQWLHAAEREPTVPSDAMQIFRVYADWGARSNGCAVHVSYVDMYRQTHMPNGRMQKAIEWGVEHGWLSLRPGKDGEPWRDGQRKVYDLTIGAAGEKRKPPPPPHRRRGQTAGNGTSAAPVSDHYDTHSGSASTNHYDTRSGLEASDHYDTHSATTTTPVVEPLREPKRRRLTADNVSLPRRGSLHAALAAVVPDVTERETLLVIRMLDARPAVQSGSAVLRREILDGNGPALVAEVRRSWPDQRPAAVAYRDLCPRCSRPGHAAAACPDREPAPDPALTASPVALAVVGQNCRYEQCRSLGPVPEGAEYHEACRHLAAIKDRRDRDEAARRAALADRAEREAAESSLHPDGGHAA